MTRKQRRLWVVTAVGACLVAAVALMLTAFQDNIVFFHSPSDIAENRAEVGRRLRLGGLVEQGSVGREADGLTITFRVTDGAASVPVRYKGFLPDLFREGQGVVAEGALDGARVFVADEVLAKHDENYMPPEVAEALKKAGTWQGEEK